MPKTAPIVVDGWSLGAATKGLIKEMKQWKEAKVKTGPPFAITPLLHSNTAAIDGDENQVMKTAQRPKF